MRGGKPKIYPDEMVSTVRDLYSAGMTQSEVAARMGLTQKIIWKLMLRHGIPRRPQIKRDQRGARNHAWRGADARYAALHLRVAAVRGKPSLCEHCGTTESTRFEWASLTKNYADVDDYVRLCCSCHHKMDGHARNLGVFAKRKEVSP